MRPKSSESLQTRSLPGLPPPPSLNALAARPYLEHYVDVIAEPVWLVDGSGRIIECNRAASDMSEGSTLGAQDGLLDIRSPALRTAWRSALAASCAWPGRPAVVRDSQSAAGETVLLWPYASLMPGGQHGLAIVIETRVQSEHRQLLPFCQAYALTPAESRLLGQLMRGLQPKEIARAIGVGESTIRTQLRSLYEKTGTRRQAELVLLAARFPNLLPVATGLPFRAALADRGPSPFR